MDNILIVDSTELSADLIAKHLTRYGYDVMTMHSAKGLFINLKVSKPDLIILDSQLGEESGYDVCRKLKNNEDTHFIPVLMMGVSDTSNSLVRALEAGADDYMPKTFEAYVIMSKVKSLIRIKHLSDQLKRQYTELTEKNSIIEMQLNMAMQVQQSLIQEYDFTFNHMACYSKYLPALDIGGDFYDVVTLNEDIMAIVIGDVSGHGISAALLTAMLNMMIRNLAPKYFNPAQFLYHMNSELFKTFENSGISIYACMFYAVIDTKKRRIYYSNAGQALPIFVDTERQLAFELDASGMPIGMMADSAYEHKIQVFNENDILLFYTDGLSDNLYKDNAEEFYTRMKSMLLDMSNGVSPEVISQALLSVFHKFDSPDYTKYERDDVSMIVCKM